MTNDALLTAVLDSWDRNNTILINLLHALAPRELETKATKDGPSVAQLFAHIHYVRLVFVQEDAPEFAVEVPEVEWLSERDPARIAEMLSSSASVVTDAVRKKAENYEQMQVHYDHPILFLQHMIWHEGYHHGQIKLALKIAGHQLPNEIAGPLTWQIWMRKK